MEFSQGEVEEGQIDPQEIKKRMKQSLTKWNSEREKNEDDIEQIRRRKEERKRELEEEEARWLAMKEEDEAEAARAEEELQKVDEIDSKEKKSDGSKANFADQKKYKTKEEKEYYEALNKAIKPFDVKSMDADQLKNKVGELYDIFTNLINDKINLNKRMVDQDHDIAGLREKLNSILDEKASKKGGIDMEKFYPGKTKHPEKKVIFSKYDNRKGARSYDERKEMYDVGTDVVRPQMLVSVWDQKFNAWMNSALESDSDEE